MSSVPHRLQQGTDYQAARPLINDNFDKVVNDVGDLGARETDDTTITFSSVTAGSEFRQTVVLCTLGGSSSYSYVNAPESISGISAAVPAYDVYIDTDNDADYLYPVGTSLSSSDKKLLIDVKLDMTSADDNVASFTISGSNEDSSDHTYYVHIKFVYFPAVPTGVFR